MPTKHDVIAIHRQHPDWSSGQIAAALDCDSAYVRATFYRNNLKLRPIPVARRALIERERCANIARQYGAERVAEAILDPSKA